MRYLNNNKYLISYEENKIFKDLQIFLFKYFYLYYIGLIIFSVYTAIGGIYNSYQKYHK